MNGEGSAVHQRLCVARTSPEKARNEFFSPLMK